MDNKTKDAVFALAVGTDRCRCCACGLPFNSAYAFDKHRVGSFDRELQGTPKGRRCMTIAEMKRRGMVRTANGGWASSAGGRPRPSINGVGLASPPVAGAGGPGGLPYPPAPGTTPPIAGHARPGGPLAGVGAPLQASPPPPVCAAQQHGPAGGPAPAPRHAAAPRPR